MVFFPSAASIDQVDLDNFKETATYSKMCIMFFYHVLFITGNPKNVTTTFEIINNILIILFQISLVTFFKKKTIAKILNF
jgi:hypothetical protein